jgi:glycosyltransferase involved in cell wall biosynthesis
MKLALVNYSRRKIGGTEQNLDVVIPELEARGHQLQFLYFHDEPTNRAPIRTGPGTELVPVARTGVAQALERLRAFRPDVINVHGEIDPGFQSELLPIAASAYSVHNYYGTCISGLKTYQLPVIQPCQRTFGPACLFNYFPRQCGGRSPVTMFRRYALEQKRLEVMSRYDAIVAFSGHMEAEYLRHGLHPTRVYGLPYEVSSHEASGGRSRQVSIASMSAGGPVRLLYVGRMERLKGGHVFLRSLPQVQRELQRDLEIHFAGDGPEREWWQRIARGVAETQPAIRIHFDGWQTGAGLHRLFLESHLLVMPSLWPEPFGKVGPEAATYGLPVAAFAVGGVGEWLIPGVNGMWAPGNPPTAGGLSGAIVGCLADAAVYHRLCEGALFNVDRFNLTAHVDRLLELFEKIRRERPLARAAGQI